MPPKLKMYISAIEHIRAIKANEEKTIKALYLQNFREVEKYVMNNNGSAQEAKDIYQEAFIAVWRNIQFDRFEPKNENSVNAYLIKIAKNKWLDHLRSPQYRKMIPLNEEEGRELEAEIFEDEDHQQINAVKVHFLQLGEMCREVLKRFYYNKESLRTISAALNWTEATARNNKYRCLQKLRGLFKEK